MIDQAMLRRYEPVRSALGIGCAQTLFMGATNVVVEGPTDQYLLSERIRRLITPDNVNELLDLNSVVMVSAESAPSAEKLLAAPQWGDEPVPATVVLLDSDEAGEETKDKITGMGRGCKMLVEGQFVLQIGTVLAGAGGEQRVVTTEDMLPPKLFPEAAVRHVRRWHPEIDGNVADKLREVMLGPGFADAGLVAGATGVLNDHVHSPPKPFDKLGVMHEAVALLAGDGDNLKAERLEVRSRLFTLCREVRRAVSASQQAARRSSGKQSIQRHIDDYFKAHKESSSVFAVQLLFERIQRDTKLLGEDGEELDGSLTRLLNELNKARSADQQHFRGDGWLSWKQAIIAIHKNPLEAEVQITGAGPIPVGESAKKDGTIAPPRNPPGAKKPKPTTVNSGTVRRTPCPYVRAWVDRPACHTTQASEFEDG